MFESFRCSQAKLKQTCTCGFSTRQCIILQCATYGICGDCCPIAFRSLTSNSLAVVLWLSTFSWSSSSNHERHFQVSHQHLSPFVSSVLFACSEAHPAHEMDPMDKCRWLVGWLVDQLVNYCGTWAHNQIVCQSLNMSGQSKLWYIKISPRFNEWCCPNSQTSVSQRWGFPDKSLYSKRFGHFVGTLVLTPTAN